MNLRDSGRVNLIYLENWTLSSYLLLLNNGINQLAIKKKKKQERMKEYNGTSYC